MEKQPVPAETIARLADEKQDVSSYFTNAGKMMPPFETGEIYPNEHSVENLDEATRENRGKDSRP